MRTAVSRLLPLLGIVTAPAWAYETNFNGGFWMDGPTTVFVDVSGATAEGSAGAAALNEAVRAAAAKWNAALKLPLLRVVPATLPGRAAGNGRNEFVFSTEISPDASFATQFGSVTPRRGASGRLLECDLVFNPQHRWLVYRGPLQHETNGDRVPDLYRVALHEFGHLLGFEHPKSDADFTIMRSRMSDVDDLTGRDLSDAKRAGETLAYVNRPRITAPSSSTRFAGPQRVTFRGTATPFFTRTMVMRVSSSGKRHRYVAHLGRSWRKAIAVRAGTNRVRFYFRAPTGRLLRFTDRVVRVR